MSSTEEPNSQLDQLRIEKSLLDIKIKEKRSELSLMEDGKADPRYLTTKTDILFLTERRNIVQSKVRYRKDNNVETATVYKPSAKGVRDVLNKFEEEREDIRLEITELRGLIASEQRKKQTSKREAGISQLLTSLATLLAKREKTSAKIRYHRKKLKK